MFVEKFIEQPRHIEIQIIADGEGQYAVPGRTGVFHSTPASEGYRRGAIHRSSTPTTRQAMGEQAVEPGTGRWTTSSAGTVEFIVDGSTSNFYFLEMNTRLQVEHPVTEKITGLDLVELMIRVAAGEELPLTQADVALSGWALETRIYAEDPLRGFLPSTGRLIRYQPPPEDDAVRVDTGVYEGGEVSMYYDPMVAKLVTYGQDRTQAIEHMRAALNQYVIRGISHNIPFLNALVTHPRFAAGNLTTHFIDEEYPEGFHDPGMSEPNRSVFVVAAAAAYHQCWQRANRISGRSPWAASWQDDIERVVVIDRHDYPVTIAASAGGLDVSLGDGVHHIEGRWRIGSSLYHANIDGVAVCVQVEQDGVAFRIIYDGTAVSALVLTPEGARLNGYMIDKPPPDLSRMLLSPMPGLLVQLKVSEGDSRKEGEELAVVEAMKMENVLRASQDVVVKRILVEERDSLVVDQPIMEFE